MKETGRPDEVKDNEEGMPVKYGFLLHYIASKWLYLNHLNADFELRDCSKHRMIIYLNFIGPSSVCSLLLLVFSLQLPSATSFQRRFASIPTNSKMQSVLELIQLLLVGEILDLIVQLAIFL